MQKRFEWPVTVAAVLVIPSMALTRSDSGSASWWIGAALNVVIWLVFAAELAAISDGDAAAVAMDESNIHWNRWSCY